MQNPKFMSALYDGAREAFIAENYAWHAEDKPELPTCF